MRRSEVTWPASEEMAAKERAAVCDHRWSHYPKNPTMARPRPYCLDCGIDIDNQLSAQWYVGHAGEKAH